MSTTTEAPRRAAPTPVPDRDSRTRSFRYSTGEPGAEGSELAVDVHVSFSKENAQLQAKVFLVEVSPGLTLYAFSRRGERPTSGHLARRDLARFSSRALEDFAREVLRDLRAGRDSRADDDARDVLSRVPRTRSSLLTP